MQITRYECDFNPNVKSHSATLRLSVSYRGSRPQDIPPHGDEVVDSCAKHLCHIVNGKLERGAREIKVVVTADPASTVKVSGNGVGPTGQASHGGVKAGSYLCECGREFTSAQGASMHQLRSSPDRSEHNYTEV